MSRRSVRQNRRAGSAPAALALPSSVAGLVLWLEADLGVTGSNPVTAWADQSGAGNNAAPLVSGPILAASGGPMGGPALTFNGTDSTSIENRAASLGNAASGQTIFAVFQATSVAAQQIPFMTANSAGPAGGYALSYNAFANAERDVLVVGNAYVADANNSATTNWEAWTVVGSSAGNAQSLRVNGAQRTTGSVAVANQGGYKVGGYGGALFFAGSFWAVLVYDRQLSAGEIAIVEAYIRAKTAIW